MDFDEILKTEQLTTERTHFLIIQIIFWISYLDQMVGPAMINVLGHDSAL